MTGTSVPPGFTLPWNTTKTMAEAWGNRSYEAGIKSHYAGVRARLGTPPAHPMPLPHEPGPVATAEPPAPGRVTASSVIDAVCAKHGIARKELLSRSRRTPVVICRQEAMHRMRAEVRIAGRPISLPEIGRQLGGLDHTTVHHGIQRHKERMRAAA